MIKELTIHKARSFFRSNKHGNQISFSEKGRYFGYIENEQVVGMISTSNIGKSIRIKSFVVNKIHKGKGIGSKLLDFVFYEGNNYSAFATEESINIFLKKGFKIVSEQKNNIKFLKYEL